MGAKGTNPTNVPVLTQLEEVQVVREVPVDLWHTTIGITIKRVVFAVVANAGLVLYNGLLAQAVDWNQVKYAALTSGLYIIISTVSTYTDKAIPNTTEAVVVK